MGVVGPDSGECPSEEAIVAFAQHDLPVGEREQVLRHIDGCGACRRAVAALGGEASPGADREVRVGRYRVRHLLGVGAMGMVFRAHDPELARDVALKLLRRSAVESSEPEVVDRLLAEARALARLAHPNVIAAYDVGSDGGEVFLAMELVDGVTLATWLEQGSHRLAEIVTAFVQAGRGLQAAHEAGVIHRDFKPDNVLVGHDRRVRVTDFGLAADLGVDGEAGPDASPERAALTQTGALLGTPTFMSPERLDGAPASPESDQFAFAVALWTGLYGIRPYGGDSIPALRQAAVDHRPRTAPRRRVPARLRSVLARALAPDPRKRWPSMAALLAQLEPFAAPVSRARWAWLAGGVALGTAAVVAVTASTEREPTCRATLPAALWSAEVRQGVQAALVRTVPDQATAVLATVEASVDRFADEWTGEHALACRLGAGGAAQRECLDALAGAAADVTALLARPDASFGEAAVFVVNSLPSAQSCRRTQAGASPDQRALANELARRVTLAEVELSAQRFDAAVRQFEEVERRAAAAGLIRLEARALSRRAAAMIPLARPDVTEVAARALDRAGASGDLYTLTTVLVDLSYAYNQLGNHERAELASTTAQGLLTGLGGDVRLEGTLWTSMCQRAWLLGKDLAAGRAWCARARAALVAGYGPGNIRVHELDTEAGNVEFMLGDFAAAVALYRRSEDGMVAVLGAATKRTHTMRGNRAEALIHLGRPAEAIAVYDQLLALGPTPPYFDGRAQAHRAMGAYQAALADHAQVRAISPDMPVGLCMGGLGLLETHLAFARWSAAEAAVGPAMADCAQHQGVHEQARLAFARAKVHAHRRQLGAARQQAAAAVELLADAPPHSLQATLRDEIVAWQAALAAPPP